MSLSDASSEQGNGDYAVQASTDRSSSSSSSSQSLLHDMPFDWAVFKDNLHSILDNWIGT